MTLRLLGLAVFYVCVFVGIVGASDSWVTLTDCRYLPNPANDGDSFHVRVGGREHIFRLYFVDAPETDNRIPARITEQSTYFHVSVSQTVQIGLEAERFTREQLAKPFIVRTCFQPAHGRSHLPRYFAFVQVDRSDLGELLVANGLARVYGAANEGPGMNTPRVEWHRLERLEQIAKSQRLGGWGIASGRLKARAASQPMAADDSLGAFFHPEASSIAPPSNHLSTRTGKLDINSASSAELQTLPGIGPVLAARIIAARPFKRADELQRVKGIKAKKYEQLRPYFQ